MRVGRLELAEDGTVFLDEISEIPQNLQVKLLRVLQEREFERVGGNTSVELKGRIVSASNRVLSVEIAKGRFREDLFYRLNTLHVDIPPLRERPEDIKELANHFLNNFSILYKKTIDGFEKTALEIIMAYRWPGNIRQLKSAVEYAALCCRNSRIEKEDLPMDIVIGGQDKSVHSDDVPALKTMDGSDNLVNKVSEIEKKEIRAALETNKWNRTRTAKELGMTVRQLANRIKKYKI